MTTVDARLMSKSAYARHRNVSPSLVTEWLKAGRIKLIGKQVDAFESDAMLARSLDPARGGKGGKSARAGAAAVPASAPSTETDDGEEQASLPGRSSYDQARTKTEEFRAKQAELAYRKAVGEVVERARVDAGVTNIASVIRRALQKLPDVLAARLAAEPDPRKVRAMLVAEIEQMLTDMADAIAAMPEQLTATRQ